MKRKDILRKLEERLARGEINEQTYLEIQARYDLQPEVLEECRAAGSARIAGSLKAEEVETSGSLQVEGSIEVEEISSSGSLSVKGRVDAEEFRSSGSVRIDGGLKAEEVAIDLGGTSKITTIEAEEIRVKATGGFFRIRGELTADRIEGEEIELEATTAAFVKGDEVRIGPHCHIDVAEARELVVHSSSEVRERRTPS